MPEEIENTIQPPEWLNTSFVQKSLRKGFQNENLKILKADFKPAVAVGDNYSSCLFRTKLTIQDDKKTYEKSVIIKSLPNSEKFVENIREWEFFVKEAEMLKDTLPKIQEVLSNVGDFPVLFPRIYYYQSEPDELLIMEDLCTSGFAGADRFEGLDLDHCILVMESIATLHAGSLALIKREPKIKERYSNGFWEANVKIKKMYSDSLIMGIEKLESWSKFEYAEKLKKLTDTFPDQVFEAVRRDENTFSVLNHGDMWTNNMMFKKSEENKVTAMKFVDFQLSAYYSPAIDLIYFLFISPRNDIRIKQLDFLLETYHKQFTKVCQALNIETNYGLEDLKKDVRKRLSFALGITLTVFPLAAAPSQDALKIDELSEEKSGFTSENNMFNSRRFKEGLLDVVEFLSENQFI